MVRTPEAKRGFVLLPRRWVVECSLARAILAALGCGRPVGPSPADQAAGIARLQREDERLWMKRDILRRAALLLGQATDRR